MWFKHLVEIVFSIGLFMNALLFIPQALKIYNTRSAIGVSVLTFAGFNLIQLATASHGYLHQDYLLMLGFVLSLFTCGAVTTLAIIYRDQGMAIEKNQA